MYKKHLILGIGIGIFVSSLIFYGVFKIYSSKISSEYINLNLEEDYIIEKATDMGMIFFDTISFENSDGNKDENGNPVVSPENFVYVTIPKNSTAIEIAQILEDAELISDKATFTNYIIDANLQRNLHYGGFLIPKGATNEQLLGILTK